MKNTRLLFLLLLSTATIAQDKGAVTEMVVVKGAVEKEVTITIAHLTAIADKPIADVVITNHLGEAKSKSTGLRGVLVRDILNSVAIKAESPKILSEFYLVFVATDGYTVVYSWNELFNSPTGESCYFITAKDGKKLPEMPDRILMLTPTDTKTGRRNLKSLSRIVVARAGKE